MTSSSKFSTFMQIILFSGGLFGFLGVVFSALTSHLPASYFAPDGLKMSKTATYVLMGHALPLFMIPFIKIFIPSFLVTLAGVCFMLGIIIFCTAVFYTAFTGIHPGPIAPVGGILLMLGWLCLAFSAFTLKTN